jgi:branched-chain amino acid transport system ATP-binding protein
VNPILSVKNLNVSYGKILAVRDLSFDMKLGTMVAIVGANGAGKTTLLNALAGLLDSKGEIVFDGAAVSGWDVEERIESGLCLVPERRELFSAMSVEDNLRLGAYVRRRDKKGTQSRMADVYRRFPRLAERRAQMAGTLSGGERQMLALGRALMAEPRILMLDEPSLGLAPMLVREIFRIIQSLRQTGVSILLVEQNARAALESAEYAFVMETGEIVISGEAAELIHDERIKTTYLGAS